MSKVYFTDFTAKFGDDILSKFERFLSASELDKIDFDGKLVAIKIHFGELGNLAFLRHQYARVLVDHIKKRGGKVFLTDANTLYPGFRGNAVDHISCASYNGYTELSAGAPIIIADGLRGTDEREIPVEGAVHVKAAKIGAAIAEADVLISLTHCKGHIEAGFGGVLKNLGMGSGSKKGKMEMHSHGTPKIDTDLCIGCGMCKKHCANSGVNIVDKKAVIDEDHCLGCGYCISYCPKGAILCKWDEASEALNEKITEYAKAAIGDKPSYHIAIINDVQWNCDCNGARGETLIPDLGIFAGSDPVAVDQACVDAINKAPLNPKGKAAKKMEDGSVSIHDVFIAAHPKTDYRVALTHGEKIGLGSREYELINF